MSTPPRRRLHFTFFRGIILLSYIKKVNSLAQCVLEEKECIGCGECDVCDLDPKKKCDSCGKCIESDADYKEIEIEEVVLNL